MNNKEIEKAQFIYVGKKKKLMFLTCPFYFVRKNLYLGISEFSTYLSGSILDFGCGAKPYIDLFPNCTKYIGMDIETSGHNHNNELIDVYYDGKHFPFEDESFDNVFSSEVFEHLENPQLIIPEIYRVIKKGGYLLVTAPFVWNEHEVPYDYYRYTNFGIRKLLENQGFEIIEERKLTSYVEIVYQMKAEYYRHQFYGKNNFVVRIYKRIAIMLQIIKGIIMSKILPDNWSLFGDNIVLCRKD